MKRSTDVAHVSRPIVGAALTFVLALVALVAPASPADVVGATVDDGFVIGSDELTGAASSYVPINPRRILDTRSDTGITRVYPNSAFSIDPINGTGVAADAGVDPDDITAVIVNTTVVRSAGGGFVSLWPTGGERPTTSTNNTEFQGHTIPNLVIAPLGLDDKISVYASVEADVILDVLGVFVAADSATAGRFEPIGPARAYDTRLGEPEIPADGTPRIIDLTDVGVPADATGVVINVTAVRSRGGGFYRVWSAGDPEPDHSSMNVLGVNYHAGNQVITGVDDGRIQVSSNVGGGLTVDVTGYFTGAGDADSIDGLFVPFTPGRLLDTRATSGATARTSGQPVPADDRLALQVAGRLDVPDTGVKAVALNLTAVRAEARGFVKAYPDRSAEPETSALNFTNPGQIVPNHAITSIDEASGEITLQPSVSTHLAVDANGYFLAADGELPTGEMAVNKTVAPGSFVPDPLPGSSPTTGPYDFLFDRGAFFATGSRPDPSIKAAWDNCAPLRYAINIDLAENDAQIEVLIASIEEMEVSTGIDFQYGGVTSAGMNIDDLIILPEAGAPFKYLPPDDNGADAVDLVVGFSDPQSTPELRGGVIGVGGSLRTDVNSEGRAEQVRGFAVIDLEDMYVGGADSAITLSNIKATSTHELGHLMGLGHVDTSRDGKGLNPDFSDAVIRDQLMFPALNPANEPDFDDGDLEGLFELYGNRPCAASGQFSDSRSADNGSDDGSDDIDWDDVTIVKSHDDF